MRHREVGGELHPRADLDEREVAEVGAEGHGHAHDYGAKQAILYMDSV